MTSGYLRSSCTTSSVLSPLPVMATIVRISMFWVPSPTAMAMKETRQVAIIRNGVVAIDSVNPGLVPGDHDQLIQLFTNLLDNAIKYGASGGVVAVAVDRLAAAPPVAGPLTGRAAIRVVVRDRGPGIARQHLDEIDEEDQNAANQEHRHHGDEKPR